MGLVIPFKLMFHREKIVFDRPGCRIWTTAEEVFEGFFQLQAPVVQTLDSAIHWINHYPLDNSIGFASVYPLDSDLSGGQRYPSFEQLGPAVQEA